MDVEKIFLISSDQVDLAQNQKNKKHALYYSQYTINEKHKTLLSEADEVDIPSQIPVMENKIVYHTSFDTNSLDELLDKIQNMLVQKFTRAQREGSKGEIIQKQQYTEGG